MKLNISNPATGAIKSVEIDDEKKLRIFYEKRISQEVSADALGDEFKGYIFKISGGNDKQGFPMMQGVMTNGRRRLLLGAGHSCYRPRRDGERRTKSVRGCIVGPDMSALNLVIIKKGDGELPDLTDKYVPRRLGPKRASKIRKLFNLSKEDDVRKYVIRRTLPDRTKGEKTLKRSKAPKIQRLITPRRLQHKRREFNEKLKRIAKAKEDAAEYAKLIAQRRQEAKARRASEVSKRRSERASQKGEAAPAESTKKRKDAPEKPAKGEKAEKSEKVKKAGKAVAKDAAATAAAKPVSKEAIAKVDAKVEAKAKDVQAAAPAKPAAKEAAKKAPAKPAAPSAKKQKK